MSVIRHDSTYVDRCNKPPTGRILNFSLFFTFENPVCMTNLYQCYLFMLKKVWQRLILCCKAGRPVESCLDIFREYTYYVLYLNGTLFVFCWHIRPRVKYVQTSRLTFPLGHHFSRAPASSGQLRYAFKCDYLDKFKLQQVFLPIKEWWFRTHFPWCRNKECPHFQIIIVQKNNVEILVT